MSFTMSHVMDYIEHNLGSIPKNIQKNKFSRWGKNNRYYAIFTDNGIKCGDFIDGIHKSKNIKLTGKEYLLIKEKQKALILDNVEHIKDYWNNLTENFIINNYFINKGILQPENAINHYGTICIPFFNANYGLCAIQEISNNGYKIFKKRSVCKGSFHIIGDKINNNSIIFIVEGVATAISAYEALKHIFSNVTVFATGSAVNVREVYLELINRVTNRIYGIPDNDEVSREAFSILGEKVINLKSNIPGYDMNDAMQENKEKTINFLKDFYNV